MHVCVHEAMVYEYVQVRALHFAHHGMQMHERCACTHAMVWKHRLAIRTIGRRHPLVVERRRPPTHRIALRAAVAIALQNSFG